MDGGDQTACFNLVPHPLWCNLLDGTKESLLATVSITEGSREMKSDYCSRSVACKPVKTWNKENE